MLPVESSTLLRIVIFSAFVGFVLFCASYATHVWLKRNRGARGASWLFRAGAGLVVAGLLGAGASWALLRFVDRAGIVDAGGLFVVHARRDGHAVMTDRQEVARNDVVATFHPPGLDDQIRVIDRRIGEAQARIDSLRLRPLEIDPVLLRRQEQLRARHAQALQFREEFARARRELDRTRLDTAARFERERGQVLAEAAAAAAALEGLRPQQAMAAGRLARAQALRRKGLATLPMLDERAAAALALRLERQRLDTAMAALATRLDLLVQQHAAAAAALDAQRAELDGKEAEAASGTAQLEAALAAAAAEMEQDRARAALRQEHEIEVARRQVATLAAERDRVVAAHQVVAPFAGRVVYRNAAPGLAPDGAAVLALSTGTGFQAKVLMPAAEIDSVAEAGSVAFALDHPVLKRHFTATFRAVEEPHQQGPIAADEGRAVAVFDAMLPQDAIGLLGIGREPVRVRLVWQPPLLHSTHLRASLLVLLAGVLLMLLDRFRGPIRFPLAGHQQGKA